ncbi:GPW/gp25 family protein [Angustibacter speluncae]
MVTTDFVGTGFAFPMGVTPAGGTAMVSGSANVEQAMLLVLGTAPGERPMRPEFGCGIHDLVFETVDDTLCGSVASEVERALTHWVPRIEVSHVDVRPDPVSPSTLLVDVAYVIRSTNDQRNLVFPFYSIPEHE